jgi:hypothetical protein
VAEKYEAERSIFGGWSAAQGYYEIGCDAGSARSCLKLARDQREGRRDLE